MVIDFERKRWRVGEGGWFLNVEKMNERTNVK